MAGLKLSRVFSPYFALYNALVYFITFLILQASTRLVRILGETGNNVMMRLMGLILMVIAVECFVSGLKPILIDILREAMG